VFQKDSTSDGSKWQVEYVAPVGSMIRLKSVRSGFYLQATPKSKKACCDAVLQTDSVTDGSTWNMEAPSAPTTTAPAAACPGPSEATDRFDKSMYRRKVIASEVMGNEKEGLFCHITVQMCEDETALTQGIDFGYGDYYRLAATPDWCTYAGTASYTYAGMYKCEGARSYSPVNPMNENTAQFIIKKAASNEEENECTAGVDCMFGFSELACMIPVGSDILMSAVTDHSADPDSTHYAYKSNVDRSCGAGPYTINVIGQGVAITETHPLGMSNLLEPVMEDGCVSTVKKVNFLWANSYWSNAAWVFEETDSTDLVRSFIKDGLKHGISFNLMHSISREERREAQFPRTNVQIIGEAFNLTNTTSQDPNIKWFVVGSSGYKEAIYPQIKQWGFDIEPCSESAAKKGYPWCGPNSLYGWEEPGLESLVGRQHSALFQYFEALPTVNYPNADAVTRLCAASRARRLRGAIS